MKFLKFNLTWTLKAQLIIIMILWIAVLQIFQHDIKSMDDKFIQTVFKEKVQQVDAVVDNIEQFYFEHDKMRAYISNEETVIFTLINPIQIMDIYRGVYARVLDKNSKLISHNHYVDDDDALMFFVDTANFYKERHQILSRVERLHNTTETKATFCIRLKGGEKMPMYVREVPKNDEEFYVIVGINPLTMDRSINVNNLWISFIGLNVLFIWVIIHLIIHNIFDSSNGSIKTKNTQKR